MKYKSQPRLSRPAPRLMHCSMSAQQPPDECSIQRVAQHALQTKAVEVETVEGTLLGTSRLRTSPGFFYLMKCRPTVHVGLLRQEQGKLQAETGVLQALQRLAPGSAPRLIAHGDGKSPLGSAYLISGPFQGSTLADVEYSVSREALTCVDRSMGRFALQLSRVRGLGFGPVHPSMPGSSSWSRFFHGLVDAVLQDGEDALVSLPYDAIREQVRGHHASLARIDEPRLVLVEMASEDNVLVDTREWRVLGFSDFSTAIWGDPFISDCFYKPSAGFLEGFGRLPNRDVHEQVRQYLYIIYHSVLAIVRASYRPSEDNDELEARRNLTTALNQLSAVQR